MANDLELVCKELNKKYKSEFIHSGYGEFIFERIPFSSPKMNYMTYGGVPRGFIVEFSGGEGGGKTTTALDICANAQKVFKKENPDNPQKVLFVDAENTFNSFWAKRLGVNVEDLLIMSPTNQYCEEIFNDIVDLIETGKIGLAVIDSLAILMSSAEFDEDFEKKQYGGISMALTKFCRKIVQLCAKTNCTLIGINQLRDNIGSMYGGTVTPGGRGWKYACILRMSFMRGRYIDDKNKEVANNESNPFGNIVNVAIEKTKCCAPNRKGGHYTLRYDRGIDYISDLIDLAIAYGDIVQAGAWYTVIDSETGEMLNIDGKDMKFQGVTKLYDELKANKELYDRINGKINEIINKQEHE